MTREVEAQLRVVPGAVVVDLEQGDVRPWLKFLLVLVTLSSLSPAALRLSCGKHDLQARPIYHHKRESIEAHLNIVFAGLAVSHWIEHQTSWSIKKFVRNARRYRTVQIRAGQQTLTAVDLIPDDLREAITKINSPDSAR